MVNPVQLQNLLFGVRINLSRTHHIFVKENQNQKKKKKEKKRKERKIKNN